MRLLRLFPLILAALLAGGAAFAQSVRWMPTDAAMSNTVQLVFEDCAPDGPPDLPSIPQVTFSSLGQSENTQISFGTGGATRLRTVTITYLIRSRQNTAVQIPAFTVKTDKGPQRVPAYNVAAPAAPLESVASSKLVPERTSVWAGEVFGLTYELSATRRTNPQISPTFDWNAAPLVAEDWSRPEVTEAVVNNERRLNVVFRTRAVAKSPNRLKLEAASHLLSIQTGTIGFSIISQPRMEQVSVTSDQPAIDVRPLPAGAPGGFSGAVGQFKLTSKVVPEKAAVGEPITWTLELSGTGNWPDIAGLPSREVSNDFQVVQPKAKRTPAEGKLFDVTLAEDVVLVPTKPGTYALGPVSFTFFDPKTGTYVTRSAPRTTVTINPPLTPQFNLSAPAPAAESKIEPSATRSATPPGPPAPPAGIPRDPLPGTAESRGPMTTRTWVLCLLSPVACLLIFWTWLAVRRAQQTDPVRPRREARDRLARTLGHLAAAPVDERESLVRAWQRDTAILWQLSHAAPRATALPEAGWIALWREADRTLYGVKAPLPTDWVARAQEALAAKSVPGFKPLRLFLPQNLMPFAALLTVAALATASLLHAAAPDGLAAYRKGDFAAAEKGWRNRISTTPTDWIARHNLSLALAQQENAGEAAAHAAAAFVQNPAEPSVRWHFALAAEKSGALAAPLSSFPNPGFTHTLARAASPATWQRALIIMAWVVTLAMAGLLATAYGRVSRRLIPIALIVIGLGVAASATALAGWIAYGVAGDANAVMVVRPTTLRSIPTEAETHTANSTNAVAAQKTSSLATGSLAVTDKTFLGWIRLAFENGQTGWVRKDDVVALWR